MLSDNIKAARKEKGLSQEEFALRLNVVRQTVSKWENGLSVPDADLLIKMAQILDIPVSRLLDTEPGGDAARDLPEELARVNGELAEKTEELRRYALAGRKRGLILLLSFAAMAAVLAVKNETLSVLILAGCGLAALTVLYRNMALLTGAELKGLRPLRLVTIFDMLLLAAAAAAALLCGTGAVRLSERGEELIAAAAVCVLILFSGCVAPKLPFNRHTGLRLPWTVRDEETWNVAHRVLGVISLPLTVLFLAAAFTFDDLGAVITAAVLAWIGIPGMISGAFFWKKYRGS